MNFKPWICACLLAVCSVASANPSLRSGWGGTPFPEGGIGTTFRVWAGDATSVHVVGDFNNWNETSLRLFAEGDGVWSRDVPGARAGQRYKYIMNGTIWRRDPRGARVVHSGNTDSIIYDHRAYPWQSDGFVPPPRERMILYELHVGTFHDPHGLGGGAASLDDARMQLDYLADLGVNVVQLMPITEFPGSHSWGYNPTDLFAVDNLTYHGPDALKRFVDACHQRGIAVLLDVVHNHYGTVDTPGDLAWSLWDFDGWAGPLGGGIYFYQEPNKAESGWGRRPDYTRPQVRDFIKDNTRMWLRDYRMDGFRWDATKLMRMTLDDQVIPEGVTLLQELNEMIHAEFTNKISVAEDLQHLDITTEPPPAGLGFDSDWHTELHHAWTEEIAKDSGISTQRLLNVLNYPHHTRRVVYTESHDEVGHPEFDQIRVPVEMDPDDPSSWRARKRSMLCAAVMLTAPGIPMLFQGQEFLTPVPFHDTNTIDWSLTNTYAGVLAFYRDAVRLRRDEYGLAGGLTGAGVDARVQHLVNDVGRLITMHRSGGQGVDDDVFVVVNFSDLNVVADGNNWLDWPAPGNWYALLNTDDPRYSDDFGGHGSAETFVWPDLRGPIEIAPWSVIVFGRTPPPTPHAAMALVGAFNGFSTTPNMRQLHDHLWTLDLEISETEAFTFKFAADDGWAVNWGAGSVSEAGGAIEGAAAPGGAEFSIPIAADGLYRFTFNSVTGAFTIRNVTPIVQGPIHPNMTLASALNGFGLTSNMTRSADGLWEIELQIAQSADFEFKLAAYETWAVSWGGDGEVDPAMPAEGQAVRGAAENIVLAGPLNGTYRFTFDESTYAYRVEQSGVAPTPTTMALAGNFNAWSALPNMTQVSPGLWRITTNLVRSAPLEFKFAANGGWALNWGGTAVHPHAFPIEAIAEMNGGNLVLQAPLSGAYTFTFNSDTLAYTIERAPLAPLYAAMALTGIGGDWSTTPNMTLDENNRWVREVELHQPGSIEFKFTANDAWTHNWGDGKTHTTNSPASGTAQAGGPDIVLPGPFDGLYRFIFNDHTRAYSIERLSAPPRFHKAVWTADGPAMILRWESLVGQTYDIWLSTNLQEGFAPFALDLPATPPFNSWTGAVPDAATAFYHIEQR